jgi:hypothetical protein
MSGTRLVPVSDSAEFPYGAVKERLLALPSIELEPVDFERMIEVGKRIGWSKELLDGHEALKLGGRCFTFRQNVPPWLRGTLYEHNVFFEYTDEQQERLVRPHITELAQGLDVRLVEY